MFSLLELIPKSVAEKLKTLQVEELNRYVQYLKETVKERVITLLHYRNHNLEALSSIPEFPYQVGLFWVGQLDSRRRLEQDRDDPLIVQTIWNKDIFLFPTLVFQSQQDLENWLDNQIWDNQPFLYREGKVYYYENFLPLGDKRYSSISIFYNKLYPLL